MLAMTRADAKPDELPLGSLELIELANSDPFSLTEELRQLVRDDRDVRRRQRPTTASESAN